MTYVTTRRRHISTVLNSERSSTSWSARITGSSTIRFCAVRSCLAALKCLDLGHLAMICLVGRPLAPLIERRATVFLKEVTNTVLIGIGATTIPIPTAVQSPRPNAYEASVYQ